MSKKKIILIIFGGLLLLLVGEMIRDILHLRWDMITHTHYIRGVVMSPAEYRYCTLSEVRTRTCKLTFPTQATIAEPDGELIVLLEDNSSMVRILADLGSFQKRFNSEGIVPSFSCYGFRIGFPANTIQVGDRIEVLVSLDSQYELGHTEEYFHIHTKEDPTLNSPRYLDLGLGSICESPIYFIRKVN